MGPLFARLSLATWELADREEARTEVRRRLAAADPDTGLTYAWDLVTSRNDAVLHLHADCTISEELFLAISARLLEAVAGAGDRTEEAFSCRCGGGCRSTPEPVSTTEPATD